MNLAYETDSMCGQALKFNGSWADCPDARKWGAYAVEHADMVACLEWCECHSSLATRFSLALVSSLRLSLNAACTVI